MSVELIKFGNPVPAIREGTKQGILKIAMAITAQAKSLAPFRHGRLRNSIMWKVATKKGGHNDKPGTLNAKEITPQPGEHDGYVGANLDYAVYKEFGTRYMAPKPFLRPAIALIAHKKAKEIVKKQMDTEFAKGNLRQTKDRVKFY